MKPKTFVDTNYLVRYAVKDNKPQVKKVDLLLQDIAKERISAYTSIVVIFEAAWTLLSFYKLSKKELVMFLTAVLSLKNLHVSRKSEIKRALRMYETSSLSLVDCYIIAYSKSTKADKIASFDIKLLKQFKK